MTTRCVWVGSDPLYLAYHDVEWGVPVRGPHTLFEFLILEGAQIRLTWISVLGKWTRHHEVRNPAEAVTQ